MGLGDLSSMVDARVTASKQRKRLYPQLCEGFLRWLDDLQRTTNRRVGFEPINAHNHFDMAHINLTLKVDNLLCLKLGEDNFRLVYPYFTENPLLSLKWARVSIWAMGEALQKYSSTDMEILDVLRGRAFRGLSISLKGDEEALFVGRYREILQKWDVLRLEYGI